MKSISTPFTALATYLQRKWQEDPFTYTRGITALLYFALIFIIISFVNLQLDRVISDIVASALAKPGPISTEDITRQINQARFIARCMNVVVYSVLVYFLLGLTLRPLKNVMESRKQFISNVSHELRTPLAVAKAEIEVALRGPDQLTQEEARVLMTSTVGRLDQMARTLQFFLILTDFNTKHSYSHEKLVKLSDCIRTVQEAVSDTADAAGVGVIVDIHDEVELTGNRIALEKMILNLVRNAITYSAQGDMVTISLERNSEKAVLSVTDTGEGIPEADLDLIFKPFMRGSNARPGGTGVGLSIVHEIARIHKAKVSVQSTPGRGSRFSILFKAS